MQVHGSASDAAGRGDLMLHAPELHWGHKKCTVTMSQLANLTTWHPSRATNCKIDKILPEFGFWLRFSYHIFVWSVCMHSFVKSLYFTFLLRMTFSPPPRHLVGILEPSTQFLICSPVILASSFSGAVQQRGRAQRAPEPEILAFLWLGHLPKSNHTALYSGLYNSLALTSFRVLWVP